MLLEIKRYLMTKEKATLQELALNFRQQPETMRSMLNHWVCKGKVCQVDKPAGCGSRCQLCKPETAEIYQWV